MVPKHCSIACLIASSGCVPLLGMTCTEIPVPDPGTPMGIIQGNDANFYFASRAASGSATGIYRITPSGAIAKIAMLDDGSTSAEASLAVDSDGNLWYPERHSIDRITTAGIVTQFTSGIDPVASDLGAICYVVDAEFVTPTGTTRAQELYFTDQGTGSVGQFFSNGTVTLYPLGDAQADLGSISPMMGEVMFVDGLRLKAAYSWGSLGSFTTDPTSSGSISAILEPNTGPILAYFADPVANAIFNVDPALYMGTGVPATYAVPTPACGLRSLANGPAIGSDYYSIMFTEQNSGKLGFITGDGAITEYALPSSTCQPSSAACAQDGTIFVTEAAANQIAIVRGFSGEGSVTGSGGTSGGGGGVAGAGATASGSSAAVASAGGDSSSGACGMGAGALGIIAIALWLATARAGCASGRVARRADRRQSWTAARTRGCAADQPRLARTDGKSAPASGVHPWSRASVNAAKQRLDGPATDVR